MPLEKHYINLPTEKALSFQQPTNIRKNSTLK